MRASKLNPTRIHPNLVRPDAIRRLRNRLRKANWWVQARCIRGIEALERKSKLLAWILAVAVTGTLIIRILELM